MGISLGNLYEISRFCGQIHAGLDIKIWVDSLVGFQSYRGLKWGVHFR